MRWTRFCCLLAAVSAIVVSATPCALQAVQELPAFSGAEGFGSTTRGGRGGRVIEVTNLNNDGPGRFCSSPEGTT